MSIEVKIRRGTTAEHSAFTGAEGEITVDTTKKTVVVHDGLTAGGIPLATESAVNECLQSVSDGKAALVTDITTMGGTVTKAGDVATFDELGSGILSIPTGGGGTTGVYRVRFIDCDGTILKEAYCDSGGSVTPPSDPDHTDIGLTFQEYNYASSAYSNVTHDLEIGATYETTDGKTHFNLFLPATSLASGALIVYNATAGATITVDWGDGNTETSTTSGYITFASHTYAASGTYTVTVDSDIGTYYFGGGTSYGIFSQKSSPNNTKLMSIYFGSKCSQIGAYACAYCISLKFVTIPNTLTTYGAQAFNYCSYALKCMIVPAGAATIPNNFCATNFGLKYISLPSSITSIGMSAFSQNYSNDFISLPPGASLSNGNLFEYRYGVERLNIPEGITSIGSGMFGYIYPLWSVTLPSTLTQISSKAFQYNYGTLEYIIKATTPPTLASTDAFTGMNSICRIKVPSASLSAYKAATYWSTYANYMEGY